MHNVAGLQEAIDNGTAKISAMKEPGVNTPEAIIKTEEQKLAELKNRQNKIDVEILKGKQALAEIERKAELKVGKEFRTEQVTPAFENVVASLTETYQESKNPAVKASPNLSAFNVTKFRREASPEIQSKYKGFKPYTFDRKGNILALPTDQYQPGDIIYDPVTTDFLIFDNAGGTYRLDPLTFEIQE